jgi:hypothetical protein
LFLSYSGRFDANSFSIMMERYFYCYSFRYLLWVDGYFCLTARRLVLLRFHRLYHLLELVLVLAQLVAHLIVLIDR